MPYKMWYKYFVSPDNVETNMQAQQGLSCPYYYCIWEVAYCIACLYTIWDFIKINGSGYVESITFCYELTA